MKGFFRLELQLTRGLVVFALSCVAVASRLLALNFTRKAAIRLLAVRDNCLPGGEEKNSVWRSNEVWIAHAFCIPNLQSRALP